jgi:hypothetical protein
MSTVTVCCLCSGLLIIILAAALSPKFRRDFVAVGEGQAKVLGILSVSGATIVLLAAVLAGTAAFIVVKQKVDPVQLQHDLSKVVAELKGTKEQLTQARDALRHAEESRSATYKFTLQYNSDYLKDWKDKKTQAPTCSSLVADQIQFFEEQNRTLAPEEAYKEFDRIADEYLILARISSAEVKDIWARGLGVQEKESYAFIDEKLQGEPKMIDEMRQLYKEYTRVKKGSGKKGSGTMVIYANKPGTTYENFRGFLKYIFPGETIPTVIDFEGDRIPGRVLFDQNDSVLALDGNVEMGDFIGRPGQPGIPVEFEFANNDSDLLIGDVASGLATIRAQRE